MASEGEHGVSKRELETVSSSCQQQDDVGHKKRRKRLPCKGSFKFQKEGGQPMPGILDFPPNVSLSKGSMMYGSLCPDSKLVRLSNFAGKMVSHMGFVKPGCKGAHFLHPEEAIFLIEAGKLLVCYNQQGDNVDDEHEGPFINSVQEAYHCLLSPSVQLSHYIVYAHLARTGFKVLISTKDGNSRQGRIYDAHTPSGDFAKTHPPPPRFRIVEIFRWDEPFPSVSQLVTLRNEISKDLMSENENVAIKIAVVAPDGDVSFYSLNCPPSS